jgi:hypothetical protein
MPSLTPAATRTWPMLARGSTLYAELVALRISQQANVEDLLATDTRRKLSVRLGAWQTSARHMVQR